MQYIRPLIHDAKKYTASQETQCTFTYPFSTDQILRQSIYRREDHGEGVDDGFGKVSTFYGQNDGREEKEVGECE